MTDRMGRTLDNAKQVLQDVLAEQLRYLNNGKDVPQQLLDLEKEVAADIERKVRERNPKCGG